MFGSERRLWPGQLTLIPRYSFMALDGFCMSFSSVAEDEKHVPPVGLGHWDQVSFRAWLCENGAIADFASGPARSDG
jgi:hypothetical protein